MKVLIEHERKGLTLKVLTQEQLTTKVSFPSDRIVDKNPYYEGASPYHLNYAGYEPCSPGYSFGPYIRKSFLLHLVSRGNGTLYKDHASYPVHKGQIFAIYPGEVTTYQASTDDPWNYYWIGFSGYQAASIMEQMGFSKETPVISVSNPEVLIESIELILSLSNDSLGDELGRTGEMLRFFSTIIKDKPAKRAVQRHSRSEYAEYALRYIANHFDQNIKISELATQIGISRCYLSKIFTSTYKMSPQEFLIRLRLEHATDLLSHSKLNITEIGRQCGYPDLFTFSKTFHKHIGCSPGEYRTRYSEE